MLYEFKCPECGTTVLTNERGDRLNRVCRQCGFRGPLVRVFAVSLHRPMMPHFNTSVGREITSMRGFKDALAQKSEDYTRTTGIEANFQPIMPGDIKRPNDDGLDGTNRARHKAGLAEIK